MFYGSCHFYFLDTEVSTIYLILLFSFFLRGQIIYTHILGFQI